MKKRKNRGAKNIGYCEVCGKEGDNTKQRLIISRRAGGHHHNTGNLLHQCPICWYASRDIIFEAKQLKDDGLEAQRLRIKGYLMARTYIRAVREDYIEEQRKDEELMYTIRFILRERGEGRSDTKVLRVVRYLYISKIWHHFYKLCEAAKNKKKAVNSTPPKDIFNPGNINFDDYWDNN